MPSNQKLPQRIASKAENAGKNGKGMEDASAYFAVPGSMTQGEELAVAVVADGIGGQKGGQEASQTAVDTVKDYFLLPNANASVQQMLTCAIESAHAAIHNKQEQHPELAGMGSTMTIAVFAGAHVYIGSLGDSRAYLIRMGEIKRLTTDHTWIQEAVDSKRISLDEAQIHPNRHVLRRYVGMPGDLKLDPVSEVLLQVGDAVVLCTDGVTDPVSDSEIKDIVGSRPPDAAASRLVDLSLERGGHDNATAMVIKYQYPNTAPIALPTNWQSLISSPLAIIGLVLGNLLLLSVVAFLILRNPNSVASVPSTPTVEIARLNIPGSRTPTPLQTPKGSTLAPTVTPLPTFTPPPPTPNWTPPPPPILRSPNNGQPFAGAEAEVVLSWDSVGDLPQDIFYLVTIKKFVGGVLVFEVKHWTRETKVKLDSAFYSACLGSDRQLAMLYRNTGNGVSSLGLLDTGPARFEWFVTMYRLIGRDSDGNNQGEPLGPSTPPFYFEWGPNPTVVPSPTPPKVYGR